MRKKNQQLEIKIDEQEKELIKKKIRKNY